MDSHGHLRAPGTERRRTPNGQTARTGAEQQLQPERRAEAGWRRGHCPAPNQRHFGSTFAVIEPFLHFVEHFVLHSLSKFTRQSVRQRKPTKWCAACAWECSRSLILRLHPTSIREMI